jgi:hypothetical protein
MLSLLTLFLVVQVMVFIYRTAGLSSGLSDVGTTVQCDGTSMVCTDVPPRQLVSSREDAQKVIYSPPNDVHILVRQEARKLKPLGQSGSSH